VRSRIVAEEPFARQALWSRRFALLGVAAGFAAVLSSHAGWLHPAGAVGLLGAAMALACVAILLAAIAMVVIWRTGRRGIPALLTALALAALLLGGPAFIAARSWRLPAIADVSTDLSDPPAFSSSAQALATRGGALHAAPDARTLQMQAAAYPEVRPLTLDLPPAAAYEVAQKLVKARHWRVLASRAPGRGGANTPGFIEAVARTPVMAFRDDVVIRITAQAGEGTRVDMRSASRFGQADLGNNAARIASFLADLDDAAAQ
jgi:uncharacterized protein (DUF1499 family)